MVVIEALFRARYEVNAKTIRDIWNRTRLDAVGYGARSVWVGRGDWGVFVRI